MTDDLVKCAQKLSKLKIELKQAEKEQSGPAARLRLLEARQSLTALIAHMRREQRKLLRQQSGATRAKQVSSAYTQLTHIQSKQL